MSRLGVLLPDRGNSFPRVSGDEPLNAEIAALTEAFSPRERG